MDPRAKVRMQNGTCTSTSTSGPRRAEQRCARLPLQAKLTRLTGLLRLTAAVALFLPPPQHNCEDLRAAAYKGRLSASGMPGGSASAGCTSHSGGNAAFRHPRCNYPSRRACRNTVAMCRSLGSGCERRQASCTRTDKRIARARLARAQDFLTSNKEFEADGFFIRRCDGGWMDAECRIQARMHTGLPDHQTVSVVVLRERELQYTTVESTWWCPFFILGT